MNKRRVTLNLDIEVAEALESVAGSNLSAVANEALREALESRAHRAALLAWIVELNRKHGAPTAEPRSTAQSHVIVSRG